MVYITATANRVTPNRGSLIMGEPVLLLTSLISDQNMIGTAGQVVKVLRCRAWSVRLVWKMVTLANGLVLVELIRE